MANYASLKAAIQQVIKTNGNNEITGALLQQSLLAMINSLGVGYQYAGIATPATNPGTPDQNVFYIASTAGTYANLGGFVLYDGEIAILKYNGAWSKDSTGIASLEIVNQLGQQVIYDVTLNNSNHPTFASLSALLSDANLSTLIPASVRTGGMSIRFVLTSDNKYVQYRLMADEFTTDTTQWAIADEDVYVENPEFVRVVLDNEGKIIEAIRVDGTKLLPVGVEINEKIDFEGNETTIIENPEFVEVKLDGTGHILWGIQKDGNVYFGAGVPEQVIDYIEEKIADLSLDEYEDIVAFLNDYLGSDTTLKVIIDSINERIPEIIESPEFLEVTTDSDGKVLAGRTPDGAAFENVGFSTPKLSIDGHIIENIEDTEGRSEITTDAEGKIISYRDSDGVKHENVGIETSKLTFSEDGVENLKAQLDEVPVEKKWYLPKFGKVNIKSETFYLTADSRWSTKDDVVCIQMYDETKANATQRLTLSYYYIKSTLTPLTGGGYDRTSVNENSVRLELGTGKDAVESNGQYFLKITKVNGTFYLTSTLDKDSQGIYHVSYIYGDRLMSVPMNYTDENVPDQTTLSDVYEVKPVTDVPPYKAWPVTKKLEHYCIADINFDSFYTKTNVPVSIKYQGSGSLNALKRGFRLTFFKNDDYKKKAKIKIGEMIRLSGFNMKSYDTDVTLIKDPVMMAFFIDMWEQRGKDCYPWHDKSPIYNGATGMIKSFPIETWIGEEFFGLQFFGMKKDEKNYLLDGDDDASGIFVSGLGNRNSWSDGDHTDWEDEMMDEMSQETADALDELMKYIKGFITGTIEIDGQTVDFTNDMLEEHIDMASFIDYYIGLQVFMLDDNSQHNVILYSDSDKKKFYAFFYDLDAGLNTNYSTSVDFVSSIETSGASEDVSLWKKLKEEYKDSILNRYTELRKSVLTIENITGIYKRFVANIPVAAIEADNGRWPTLETDPKKFENTLTWIKNRLKYLDKNYFNIQIN